MNQETKKPSIKLALTRPRKRIRIFCNDPDATDSSSDDDGVIHNKLKRVCFTIEDSNNGEKNPNKPGLVTGKYKGVRLRKWGRWGAEIRDPISRKKIWLGHYNTAEEASHAYEMKRMEFDALINPVDLSSEKSSNNVVQRIEKPKACLSSDSSVTAFSLTSNTSPSSVLEMDSKCEDGNANSSSIVATNANEPDKGVDLGILDEDLTAPAHIGAQIDLDLDRNPLGEFDFPKDFEDIPLFGFENTYTELPDFDFDFDFETWMDDAPIGTNTNGAEPVLNRARAERSDP